MPPTLVRLVLNPHHRYIDEWGNSRNPKFYDERWCDLEKLKLLHKTGKLCRMKLHDGGCYVFRGMDPAHARSEYDKLRKAGLL